MSIDTYNTFAEGYYVNVLVPEESTADNVMLRF